MIFTSGWKLTGTKSFRLGSTKLLDTWGNNGQNQDKLFLTCLVARPSKLFVQADQAGAEALIVAYEAPAGRFRKLFELDIKPHTYMALQLFLDKFRGTHDKSRYDTVEPQVLKLLPEWSDLNKLIKNSDVEYGLGKTTIHASNYDMKWPTFQNYVLVRSEGLVVLSAPQAKQFLQVHRKSFPEIAMYHQEIRAKVEGTRTLHNLFGHPRSFHGRLSEEMFREAYSWIPQSTVGEITNNACCELQEYIENNRLDWNFINNKHDSLAVEVPEDEHLVAAALLKRLLEVPLVSSLGVPYNMRSEVSIGRNLGKHDKDKNIDGMKEIKV